MSCRCSGSTSPACGESQKEFFVNEAHALADALLHPAVEGESNDPPVAPDEGESWLVGTAPTGAWADHAGELASLQGGAWIFAVPRDGMRVFDLSSSQHALFLASWQCPATPATPSGGATIDAEARTAIAALVAALVAGGFLAAT